MLGCFAEALNADLTIDEAELTDARWITREEARIMMARGVESESPHIPGSFSIAAWLINSWVDME